MKYKLIVVLFLVSVILAGCDVIDPAINMNTNVPTAAFTEEPTQAPAENDMPTEAHTQAPAENDMPTEGPTQAPAEDDMPTEEPTQTPVEDENYMLEMEGYLPPLDTTMRYFGIAETGHYGTLSLAHNDATGARYDFFGTYDDGMGVPDEFEVQYFFDYWRGTITEKAISNERLNKAEFNSKLHNIVVLKFPIMLGAEWSHSTTINGEQCWVYAEVIEYDGDKVVVRYTATDVSGYYNNTYIEQRTFEKGYGMTGFSNLLSGDLDLSGCTSTADNDIFDYIMNMYMFGYSLYKEW